MKLCTATAIFRVGNETKRTTALRGTGHRLLRTLHTQRGTWLVTYCSFVLMLLALFIMLTSFSAAEASRVSRFVHSFRHAVSIFTGGAKLERSEKFTPPPPGVMKKDECIGQLREVIEDLKLEGLVQLEMSDKGLVMTLADRVLFEAGQAELSSPAFPLLHKVAAIIVETGAAIRIAGHTDNVPIHTARFSSNWELSTARAVNVLRYFQEVEQVSAERLSAVGYGEFHPIGPNETPAQRLANRRVEIIFVGEQPDPRREKRFNG
jgi:chemotaxis protein MotB